MDALPAISPEDIPRLAEISIDLRVTGFALLVSLLTASLFGPAPAPRARSRGASFCKYVCPIGMFNFAQSLVSPLEVKIRNTDVCRACTTYDCIRGNDMRRGCELALFQPKKSGNLDCTFCLDCVHACPHQNVGIIATTPGSQLTHDRYRSSLGRLSQRMDVAALLLLLVFGAFANAAGMIEHLAALESALQRRLGIESLLPVTSALFVLALIVAPLLLVGLCCVVCRALGGGAVRWRELICRFALALAPLGFSEETVYNEEYYIDRERELIRQSNLELELEELEERHIQEMREEGLPRPVLIMPRESESDAETESPLDQSAGEISF